MISNIFATNPKLPIRKVIISFCKYKKQENKNGLCLYKFYFLVSLVLQHNKVLLAVSIDSVINCSIRSSWL